MTLAPVLSRHWDQPQSWTLQSYTRQGGYQALRTVLRMPPAEVIALVKDSGLRGRGGAGFPTGTKWSFISPDDGRPHYLVVNADESEPGTCKDIPLMLASPHALVEGAIIASYAIGARHAFIYVRGEVVPVLRRLQGAVAEAYANGYLGTNIAGTGFDLDLVVHAGAGAYICGEETALLDSLEGRRGQPRLRPRSRRSPGCTPARPWSTTSSRSPVCRRSSAAGSTGSAQWGRRSRRASPCTHCRVMSPGRGNTKHHWAFRCGNCWSTPAGCEPGTS